MGTNITVGNIIGSTNKRDLQGTMFNNSLVNAWFMSDLRNDDKPKLIKGIKSNKFYSVDFTKIYGTASNISPHTITLDNNYLYVLNNGQIPKDGAYTIPSYKIQISGNIYNDYISIGYEDITGQHSFIETVDDGVYTIPAHTFKWNVNMDVWVTTIQTVLSQNASVTISQIGVDTTNDLVTSNFAWNEMSGIGGYTHSYIHFGNSQGEGIELIKSDSKCTLVRTGINPSFPFLSKYYGGKATVIPSYSVKISNLPKGKLILILTTTFGEAKTELFRTNKDGVYNIPQVTLDKDYEWYIEGASPNEYIGVTIEQLPLYPGSLVFDGVDDYCYCDCMPILTDYTVIYNRNCLGDYHDDSIFSSIGNSGHAFKAAFWIDYAENNMKYYSFGQANIVDINFKRTGTSTCTKTTYNGIKISPGSGQQINTELLIGGTANGYKTKCTLSYYALYNRSLTQEEIDREIIKLDKEWARRGNFQYIPSAIKDAMVCWYDPRRQGLTNEDIKTTNNVLKDLSGNRLDAKLTNFAGTETSGVNSNNELVFDGVDDYVYGRNQPILTDYTVMANRSTYAVTDKATTLACKPNRMGSGAFLFELGYPNKHGNIYSFGLNNTVALVDSNFTYTTPTDYNGQHLTKGTDIDNEELFIGIPRLGDERVFKGILRAFLIFNRTLTVDEIEWVKNNLMN